MKRLVLALAFALAACDGGGASSNDPTVIAVRVTPANPTTRVGETIPFVATAFQVNGEQRLVTEDVTWATSAASVLSIDADGLATGQAVGEAFVIATLGDIASPAQKVIVNPGPTPTPTPVLANHVVISEVMFNAAAEPSGQYVELHNPTAAPVTLTGWTVAYNNTAGNAFTFPSFTLAAGTYVVLANSAGMFGGAPYPPVTNLFVYAMPNLSNTGDWFVLENDAGAKIDEMAYGTGYLGKPAGWCGTNSPTATTNGTSVSRKPVNSDTDTCVDWVNSTAANPGQPTP